MGPTSVHVRIIRFRRKERKCRHEHANKSPWRFRDIGSCVPVRDERHRLRGTHADGNDNFGTRNSDTGGAASETVAMAFPANLLVESEAGKCRGRNGRLCDEV